MISTSNLSRSLLLLVLLMFSSVLLGQSQEISRIDNLIIEAKEVFFGYPAEAMILANEIYGLSDTEEYENGKLEALRLIGNCHYLMGRLDSAAFYMLETLERAYAAENLAIQADVMIDIGQTYDKIGLHSLALDYFIQAHEIRLQTNDAERLSVTFINLAFHFFLRDQLDTALYYYDKTKAILDTIPVTYTTPFLYNELGGVYLKKGIIPQARTYIEKAMELNIQLENNWDLSANYIMLAELELAIGNTKAAEKAALNALTISKANNIAIEYDVIYKILSEVKSSQGFEKEAFEFLSQSYQYTDSLDLALTDQKMLALDHYKQQKENEIATLKLVNKNLAQEARIGSQNLLILSITIILLATLGMVGILYRQNIKLAAAKKLIQEQNEDLRNLNKTKNKLFSIVSHDIRNPLGNLNGMLQLAKDGLITVEEFSTYSGALVDQTDRLTTLSETLINWSKSQQQGLKTQLEPINIDDIVRQSISYLDFMANNKKVMVKFDGAEGKNQG